MAKEQEWKEILAKRLHARKVDAVQSLDLERRRRRKYTDDDFREPYMDTFDFGKTHYAHIPFHEPWQHTYMNVYGKVHKIDKPWKCPRCGTEYHTGYPPIGGCQACKRRDGKVVDSPIDEMIKDGVYKR